MITMIIITIIIIIIANTTAHMHQSVVCHSFIGGNQHELTDQTPRTDTPVFNKGNY